VLVTSLEAETLATGDQYRRNRALLQADSAMVAVQLKFIRSFHRIGENTAILG
jgi:hypothetical protein